MTITNGYVSLTEFQDYLLRKRSYTAATISITNGSGSVTISDSTNQLGRFVGARLLQVAGSLSANNGTWVVQTVENGSIVVIGSMTDAVAGASITLTNVSDAEDNDKAEWAVEAASRSIDDFCYRRFYKNGVAEARYFTPHDYDCFFPPDDIVSITELATDPDADRTWSTVWTSGDYDLLPFNAALDGKPYTQLQITPNGDYTFPRVQKGLKITGVFGWPAVPAKVKEATFIQASRLYERRKSPFGVIAVTDAGAVTVKNDLDPDVQVLLYGLRKLV